MMREYDSKAFKNVAQGDLNLETEEEKKELEKKEEENKDLLTLLKEALNDKVEGVKISSRLKSHPVCLASSDCVSFEIICSHSFLSLKREERTSFFIHTQ